MISVDHTFSTQKRRIIKLIAEYRYIAKVVWFHNILPLQTILPLHNFTNYLKMFLLKANMIYINLSEAAGIQRKADAFTVWKTTLYLGTQKSRQQLLGKEMQKFSIRDHILFFTNYIIKTAIWDKACLAVCLLIWLVLFKCVQLQSLILKILRYTITFVFKLQNVLPTTVIHSTCIFFNYILWFNQKLQGKTVGEIYGLYYQATPA